MDYKVFLLLKCWPPSH